MRKHWILVTIVAGTIVGGASATTNGVPIYDSSQTLLTSILQLVAGVANSFVVWFAVPLAVGYLLCRTWKQAIVAGSLFMVAAIIAHFVGSFNEVPDQAAKYNIHVVAQLALLLQAAIGGAVGGILGFLAQKRPLILLTLVPVIVLELVRRGEFSWQSPVSVGENIVFIVLAVGLMVYVGIVTLQRSART